MGGGMVKSVKAKGRRSAPMGEIAGWKGDFSSFVSGEGPVKGENSPIRGGGKMTRIIWRKRSKERKRPRSDRGKSSR